MRRRPFLGAVGALAACLPAAAGASPALATGRHRVVFWTMQLSPFHDNYVRGLIQSFEARQPRAQVIWVDVPWAEMERKALASIAAGTQPDVLNLNPQFSARLAELGALADPRQWLSASEVASYLPAAWAANQLGGVPFALPWYLSTTLTLANRSVLQRAGVGVPLNFEQLREAARAVRASGAGYAWFPALDGAAPLEAMVSMNGPLLTPEGCRPAFAGAGGTAVFDYYRELFAQAWVPPSVLTEGHRSSITQFLSGQVAMVATGMQFLGTIKSGNPALYAQIVVAPQTTGPLRVSAGNTAASPPNIAAMNLAVPSNSRVPELAFRFAAHVTNAVNQLELARRVPLLPSAKACFDDVFFTRPMGDGLLDQARAISVRQVFEGAVLVPPMRRYNKLRSSFIRGLHSAMAGRSTPAQAIDGVVRVWTPLLGCAPEAEGRLT